MWGLNDLVRRIPSSQSRTFQVALDNNKLISNIRAPVAETFCVYSLHDHMTQAPSLWTSSEWEHWRHYRLDEAEFSSVKTNTKLMSLLATRKNDYKLIISEHGPHQAPRHVWIVFSLIPSLRGKEAEVWGVVWCEAVWSWEWTTRSSSLIFMLQNAAVALKSTEWTSDLLFPDKVKVKLGEGVPRFSVPHIRNKPSFICFASSVMCFMESTCVYYKSMTSFFNGTHCVKQASVHQLLHQLSVVLRHSSRLEEQQQGYCDGYGNWVTHGATPSAVTTATVHVTIVGSGDSSTYLTDLLLSRSE